MPVKIKLILASGSPQRKRILESLGIPFRAIPSNVAEDAGRLRSPSAIAKHLALKKALAISKLHRQSWVLGVDTLVVLPNGKISGKPKNKTGAKQILKTYCGRHCDVISGIALVNTSLHEQGIGVERARLYFRDFTEKEIDEYLSVSTRWKGSSGAMTIEGVGGHWVKRLEGDYWNVVGLPLVSLKKMLRVIRSVWP